MKNLSGFMKTKINSYFSTHKDVYYNEFSEYLGYEKNKYSKLDILNYLINFVEDGLKMRTKVSTKLLEKYLKMISAYMFFCFDDDGIIIKGDLKKIVDTIDENYKKYKEQNDMESQKNIDASIEEFKKFLKEYNNDTQEAIEKEERILKELQENLDLEESDISNDEENKVLITEDNELLKKIEALEKKIKSNSKTLDSRKEKIKLLNQELKELKKVIENNQKSFLEMDKEKKFLLNKIEELEEYVKSLLNKNDEIIKELHDKDESISKLSSSKEYILGTKLLITSTLDSEIFDLIFGEKLTINEIIQKLSKKNIFVSSKEVIDSLNRLKQKYQITGNELSVPKVYGLSSATAKTNKKLILDSKEKRYIDVLKIADLHISMKNINDLEKLLNIYYDLCERKNIETVINLGDFIDYRNIDKLKTNKEKFNENKRLLDTIIEVMPSNDSINHVILGGNHDRDGLKYGFSPLDYIADNRSDVISLGYDNAILNITSDKKMDNYVGLHHRCVPFHDIMDDIKIKTFLDSVHDDIRYKDAKGNIFCDFCGHLHDCYYNPALGYAVIPNNGCWYVRYNLNSNGKLEEANITTYTNIGSNLVKTMETSYRKNK